MSYELDKLTLKQCTNVGPVVKLVHTPVFAKILTLNHHNATDTSGVSIQKGGNVVNSSIKSHPDSVVLPGAKLLQRELRNATRETAVHFGEIRSAVGSCCGGGSNSVVAGCLFG